MVNISYMRIKNTFFRESEREKISRLSRILLFNSEHFLSNKTKNRMHLSAVCFNFAKHNNEINSAYSKNTGLKTNQFWLDKYRTEHIWG